MTMTNKLENRSVLQYFDHHYYSTGKLPNDRKDRKGGRLQVLEIYPTFF